MGFREIREMKLPSKQSIFLSSMMIAVGIICIIVEIQDNPNDIDWVVILSKFALIVCGVIALVYKNRNNYFTIGLYAIGFGSGRVIRSLATITSDNDIVFIYSVVMLCLGINLTYSGINFLTVRTRNPSSMIRTALLLLLLYLFLFVFILYTNIQFDSIRLTIVEFLGYILLYIAFISALMSKAVTENTPFGALNGSLNDISLNAYIGDVVTINESDIDIIREGFSDTCGWERTHISGCDMAERTITLNADGFYKDLIIQRWSDTDNLTFFVVVDKDDSFITYNRFEASEMKESDGYVEFYLNGLFQASFCRGGVNDG